MNTPTPEDVKLDKAYRAMKLDRQEAYRLAAAQGGSRAPLDCLILASARLLECAA